MSSYISQNNGHDKLFKNYFRVNLLWQGELLVTNRSRMIGKCFFCWKWKKNSLSLDDVIVSINIIAHVWLWFGNINQLDKVSNCRSNIRSNLVRWQKMHKMAIVLHTFQIRDERQK